MEIYQRGEILLLKFPFSDEEDAKRRPALLLFDVGDEDIVVARITTHLSRSTFDIEIKQSRQAGLKAPSVIRLHKVATLEKSLIDRKPGKLSDEDWKMVQTNPQFLWTDASKEESK